MSAMLLNYCHPHQRALVADKSPRKAALCGRRSGKTAALAVELLRETLRHPGELCIAIALSRQTARELFGSAIRRVSEEVGFSVTERTVDGALYICPEWGGRILLGGCDDRAAVEKYRGDRSPLVVVDEADSMRPWLQTLTEDVLEPRLLDLGGRLILTGTPGPTPAGYFHKVTTGGKWACHHWDIRQNPFIRNAEEVLKEVRENRPEATVEREWLGRWFTDIQALCFPFDRERNGATVAEWRAATQGKDTRTLTGIDIGYGDPCAWVTWQWVPGIPTLWVIRAKSMSGLTPSSSAARTLAVRADYPGSRLVADSGGIGKGYIEEWIQKHGLPVSPAQKSNKAGSMADLAGALITGQVRVVESECQPLLDEWSVLQWNDARTGPREGQADHCSDAARYGHRELNPANRPEVEYTEEEQAKRDRADYIRSRAAAGNRRR